MYTTYAAGLIEKPSEKPTPAGSIFHSSRKLSSYTSNMAFRAYRDFISKHFKCAFCFFACDVCYRGRFRAAGMILFGVAGFGSSLDTFVY